MLVTDYTTKIKQICDALWSIIVTMEEDRIVQIYLGVLVKKYGPIHMAICMREKPMSFFAL